MRTTDHSIVSTAITTYAEEIVGLNLEEWLADPLNIALTNDNGDVAMFEHQVDLPMMVCGHYFFFSRGKHAVKAAKEFLEELFEQHYPEGIIGVTPVDHKAALWMNRHLGFKDCGELDTEIGKCRFVVLTRQQWKDSLK